MARLTAATVKSAKPGRHTDGDGLALLVKPSGARSWVLRVQVGGKRRDIGLGSVVLMSRMGADKAAVDEIPILERNCLSLAEAREKARILRTVAKSGHDPIAARDRHHRGTPSFKEAAEAAHEALKEGWSEKNASAFLSSLEEHAYPTLRDRRVDRIEAGNIIEVLKPIWLRIPVMARKVRQHISKVLDYSHSQGWRETEAPRRSVSVGLPNQPEDGHFRAMPYEQVPKFVADMRGKAPSSGRLALLFQIYTGARPGEVRFARWEQIDFAKKDWNRPAAIMKGRQAKGHTVTLNKPALDLLEQLRTQRSLKPGDLIFPGKGGKPMSDMTIGKALKTAKQPYDAHGFRSSFRDWAAERVPGIPDPVAEAALAHAVPDRVVRAYKRTKFIEMRRKLLLAWGKFTVSEMGSSCQ
jgi:integrase